MALSGEICRPEIAMYDAQLLQNGLPPAAWMKFSGLWPEKQSGRNNHERIPRISKKRVPAYIQGQEDDTEKEAGTIACLVIAWAVFGYVCRGNILWLYLFTVLDIIVMAGLGLLISNYSGNAQQAMFVIWFFAVIFMLMSGIFTPIASMPDWAECITYLNPMRYYADAMRAVFLKGSTPADLWYDIAGLAALGTIMVGLAISSYKKSE